MDAPASRDGNGRFAAGNAGGPGRSRGRGYELLRAAQDAITPDQIAVMMRKALRMALEGNVTAMKFVMERTCGRPPELPAEPAPLDVTLPNLRTVESCIAAIDKLATAVTGGTADLAAAKVLLDIVHARMKAIELNEHERRLAELEKAAASVELPGARRGY